MSHDGQWFHTVLSVLFMLRVAAWTWRKREAAPVEKKLVTALQEIRRTTTNEGRN